jgi:predicted protein tyrosine phosphatase
MITKIVVVSRQMLSNFFESNLELVQGCPIISIHGSDEPPLPLTLMGANKFLSLQFDDISDKFEGWEKYIFFSKEQGKQIIDFGLEINRGAMPPVLIVQCNAGISRSGAVGLFLNEMFGLSHKEFIQNNHGIMPNPLVLSVLNQLLREGSR